MPRVPNIASARITASWKPCRARRPAPRRRRRGARRRPGARRGRRAGGDRLGDHLPRPLGGLDRRVADHQRHPRGVAAEVDRRQIGVADAEADVAEPDAEHLGHDRREHRVRALADLRLAAEDGDAAAAVELELDAGLRHVVPVDRQPGAAQVGAAGEAEAAAGRQLAVALLPARAGDHRLDAARRGPWCRCAASWRSPSRRRRGGAGGSPPGRCRARAPPCRGGSRRRSGAAACRGRASGRTAACW